MEEQVNEYQYRLQTEYKELKEKYNKLHKMIIKVEAGTVNITLNCNIDLLKRQAKAMGEYLYVLELRAEIEGICLD